MRLCALSRLLVTIVIAPRHAVEFIKVKGLYGR